jgi:hypothetical protein
MPNWCDNQLEVVGDRDELQRFVDATKNNNEEGSHGLNHLFPIPEQLVETTSGWFSDPDEQAKQTAKEEANVAKFGHKDWYDWALENWGSKWGASNFQWTSFDYELDEESVLHGAPSSVLKVKDTDKYIGANFQSAWGPCDGLIKTISTQFPTLIFSVVSTEESDAFACYSIFRNGELLAEDGETPKMPAEIMKLGETDDDSFYERLMDWQTEYQDKWNGKADKALQELMK